MSKYITVQEYVRRHTWPPIGGLRHLVRNSATNGLDEVGALMRVGRRLLIDEKVFMEWMGSKKNA